MGIANCCPGAFLLSRVEISGPNPWFPSLSEVLAQPKMLNAPVRADVDSQESSLDQHSDSPLSLLQIKVVEVFGPKETKGALRDRRNVSGDVKVLSRVQELRLLTKVRTQG